MRRIYGLVLTLAVFGYCNGFSENGQLDEQKESMRKQMAKLLALNPSKLTAPKQTSRSSSAAARYMQKLYFKHAQNPGPYEGSTVRSISPQLVTSELENVDDISQLVFNLGAIHPNERILRAEIHFNQRIHRANVLRALPPDYYKAKAQCASCSTATMLQLDRTAHSRQWITFIATDLVDDAVNNNRNQLKVQFTRHDIPILSQKALRIHSPFLLVFTQQVNEKVGETKMHRSKRSVDSYYQYLPVDDTDSQEETRKDTITSNELNSDAKKPKKPKFDPNDPMMGFGQVEEDKSEQNRINKNAKLQKAHNDLTVYLLGSEQEKQVDKKQCAKRDFVVNFRDIGWDEWVIAPKKFEAHYCAGSCEFPLAEDTNPSNHAQLQSIAHSMGLLPSSASVCCVPDRLDSQTLLYYDEDGNVVLKNYPKMIAQSCACQ
ncbi:Bone morphogenetic protein 3B [Aphelenchoides bicaudatus]|nr:Bone morphogenetic protein 3B [Aphelenchoides bicaudatus]